MGIYARDPPATNGSLLSVLASWTEVPTLFADHCILITIAQIHASKPLLDQASFSWSTSNADSLENTKSTLTSAHQCSSHLWMPVRLLDTLAVVVEQ